jgi:hypothetical protein
MDGVPAFTEDQWQKILNRLIIYAQRKYFKLGWKNKDNYRSPSGKGPEDIASEVIEEIIENRRIYDAQKQPDFEQFLKACVDSVIYNLIHSSGFEKKKAMPYVITDEGETEEIDQESKEINPLQICVTKDLTEKVKSILQSTFSEDKLVCGIIDCLDAGIDKPSELAEYLEIDVKEIYSAQRKLQREVEKNLQKYKLEYQK